MAIEIRMPRLSDTMEVGTLVKWNVKPGQKVRSGDVIADIETDKATMELQSFDDGEVSSMPVKEGQSVPIGTVILVLSGADGESASARKESAAVGAGGGAGSSRAGVQGAEGTAGNGPGSSGTRGVDASGATMADAESAAGRNGGIGVNGSGANGAHTGAGTRVFVSPLARKIAREHDVDLVRISGTGPSGRIVRKDVESAIESGIARGAGSDAIARIGRGSEGVGAGGLATRIAAPAVFAAAGGLAARVVALSNMRRTIAARLVESKTTIPHYQVTMTARTDALLGLRAQLNEQLATLGPGVKLSVNDFLVRACALAMHQHPMVNARWVGTKGSESIEVIGAINIGVAVSLPEERGGGLVVATIRQADVKGLRQISTETKSLAEKARTRGLTVEEMSDTTFTISNLGMFGVEHFSAIINPPNAAILAVGAAVEKALVDTDARTGEKRVVIGHEMSLTMSSDHRIIDGAMAASYLGTVKGMLEKPATLLV